MADDDSQNKPSPVGPIAGGAAGGAALVAGVTVFKSHLLLFVGLLVALLVVLVGGYLLFVALKKRRQGRAFGEGLEGSTAASPRGISDPAKRAKLEDLRQKFEEGIKAYRSRGKDLYSLPWYVIVGEPGGGKSEAIRRSNIGFPPGLQDEFQGVGGTINMHWWFSDNAVLLDTAGRLIFEEVAPGESSEWKEFLTLLRNTRPNCPINGLLLVIPCDSLIKDTEAALDQKARKIAQQLDLIQRTLDVRFPVSVLITKCDLLPGFREFFENLKDPKLQQQMLGWSNPNPRDTPFKADEVDQYLQQVTGRLARRRLAMLRDPAPETAGNRRADEVDALFSLPNSLTGVSTRLRRYLETIFQTGAWSLPPLFLRGIYLSSSLREGAALDAELASALGLPVESVGDFKVWERERSFFLKDLFVQKVFKERGLVTRATNTQAMLKARRTLLFGGGIAALVIFVAFAWMGMSSFKMSIASQAEAWRSVADSGWEPKSHVWNNSLIPLAAGDRFAAITNAEAFNRHQEELGFRHLKIRQQSTNRMNLDWLARFFFTSLATDYNENSANAQRIVFETGVIHPLISATRQRFKQDAAGTPPEGEAARRQMEALRAMLLLEAETTGRSPTNTGRPTPEAISRIADPMLRYLAGVPLDTNLVATWSWLYSESPATLGKAGSGSWPPTWLSDHKNGEPLSLQGHEDLRFAVDAVVAAARANVQKQDGGWSGIAEAHKRLKTLSDAERGVWEAVREKRFQKAEEELAKFIRQAKDTDFWLNQNKLNGFLREGSLKAAVEGFRSAAGVGSGSLLGELATSIASLTNRPPFDEIGTRLRMEGSQLQAVVANRTKEISEKELDDLDRDYLKASADNVRAFAARATLYDETLQFLGKNALTSGEKIGRQGRQLGDLDKEAEQLAQAADKYSGPLAEQFRGALTLIRKEGADRHVKRFQTEFLSEVATRFQSAQRFPIDIRKPSTDALTVQEIGQITQAIGLIRDDLRSEQFVKHGISESAEGMGSIRKDAERLLSFAEGFVSANGQPNRVTVVLLAQRDVADDEWRNKFQFTKPYGNDTGKAIRIGFAGANRADNELGKLLIGAAIPYAYKERSDSTEKTVQSGAWGAVELIQRYSGTKDPADGSWIVEWPVAELGGKVRLRLRFDRAVPALEAR